MTCHQPKQIRGQALIEWVLFGTAIFSLWIASMHLARGLLAKTVTEAWSVFSARQALSKIRMTEGPEGLAVKARSTRRTGASRARFDGAQSRYHIEIPEQKTAASALPSLFSGFRSSQSSE